MTRCKKCCLRIKGKYFCPDLYRKIPLHLRHIFICNEEFYIESGDSLQNQSCNYVCPLDLWVLTFIGTGDSFAIKNAESTLDSLVEKGESELLCNLFENSPYEVRRELWLKMTTHYKERLYLFDSLFEKNCLAPLNGEQSATGLHFYQNSMLFSNSGAPAMFDDL